MIISIPRERYKCCSQTATPYPLRGSWLNTGGPMRAYSTSTSPEDLFVNLLFRPAAGLVCSCPVSSCVLLSFPLWPGPVGLQGPSWAFPGPFRGLLCMSSAFGVIKSFETTPGDTDTTHSSQGSALVSQGLPALVCNRSRVCVCKSVFAPCERVCVRTTLYKKESVIRVLTG